MYRLTCTDLTQVCSPLLNFNTLPIYGECFKKFSQQRDFTNISKRKFCILEFDDVECESHLVMSDSLWPHGLYIPWNSPGQNTGVGSCSLLWWIFPTQGSNPGLPHCRWILYQLSHQWSPILSVTHIKSFNKYLWTPAKCQVWLQGLNRKINGHECLPFPNELTFYWEKQPQTNTIIKTIACQQGL